MKKLLTDESGWHEDPLRALLDVGIRAFSPIVEGPYIQLCLAISRGLLAY